MQALSQCVKKPQQEIGLDCLRELKKLDLSNFNKPKKENVKLCVVFNIPVDTNTDDYVIQLLQAATIVATTGLEVCTTKFILPKSMRSK